MLSWMKSKGIERRGSRTCCSAGADERGQEDSLDGGTSGLDSLDGSLVTGLYPLVILSYILLLRWLFMMLYHLAYIWVWL